MNPREFWESADKVVKKQVIQVGSLRDQPTECSVCTITVSNFQSRDFTIEHAQNHLFSSIISSNSRKLSMTIGESSSRIDRELERAIITMSPGEHSLVTIKIPMLEIPDNITTLSVEIILEEVQRFKPVWEWTLEEKHKVASKYKELGVCLFGSKRHVDAFFMFSRACKILITLEPIDYKDPSTEDVRNLRLILYNNMAECQLSSGNYEHVITLCTKVLSITPDNVKALYRRGLAFGNLKDYEKAVADLKIVLDLEPKNTKALEHYKVFHEHWKKSCKGYENIVKKMFKN